jgi:hypothetical protein
MIAFYHARGKLALLMVAAVMLWLLAFVAMSGPVILSWELPTKNTDGTPISDLKMTTLHRKSGSSWVKLTDTPPEVTVAMVSLPAGTNVVRVTLLNRFGESSQAITNVVVPFPQAVTNIESFNAD